MNQIVVPPTSSVYAIPRNVSIDWNDEGESDVCASDLQIPPGVWPEYIAVHGGSIFKRMGIAQNDGDIVHVVYGNVNYHDKQHRSLTVFND